MAGSIARNSLKNRLYVQLEPSAWPRNGLSPLNRFVCILIVVSAGVAIVETEKEVFTAYKSFFLDIEWLLAAIFGIEYVARLWVSSENPRYGRGLRAHIRYVFSPPAILDLLALLPVLLTLAGSEAFLLRLARLLRILRLARLGRFSQAIRCVGEAVRSRRYELGVSAFAAVIILIFSSTLLYFVEGGVQPVAFGSIPRAMWWSIATLTTVGYGDVYPTTGLGRVLAAVTAMAGIGLIAMPAGILAAAFSDAIQRSQSQEDRDHE